MNPKYGLILKSMQIMPTLSSIAQHRPYHPIFGLYISGVNFSIFWQFHAILHYFDYLGHFPPSWRTLLGPFSAILGIFGWFLSFFMSFVIILGLFGVYCGRIGLVGGHLD